MVDYSNTLIDAEYMLKLLKNEPEIKDTLNCIKIDNKVIYIKGHSKISNSTFKRVAKQDLSSTLEIDNTAKIANIKTNINNYSRISKALEDILKEYKLSITVDRVTIDTPRFFSNIRIKISKEDEDGIEYLFIVINDTGKFALEYKNSTFRNISLQELRGICKAKNLTSNEAHDILYCYLYQKSFIHNFAFTEDISNLLEILKNVSVETITLVKDGQTPKGRYKLYYEEYDDFGMYKQVYKALVKDNRAQEIIVTNNNTLKEGYYIFQDRSYYFGLDTLLY